MKMITRFALIHWKRNVSSVGALYNYLSNYIPSMFSSKYVTYWYQPACITLHVSKIQRKYPWEKNFDDDKKAELPKEEKYLTSNHTIITLSSYSKCQNILYNKNIKINSNKTYHMFVTFFQKTTIDASYFGNPWHSTLFP